MMVYNLIMSSKNSILRYSIIAGIFATLIVPLIVTNSFFFPFITGKAFTFRIIVEIIFALWLILCFADKSYRPRFSWITIAATALLVIILIADIFGVNTFKAFWSNFERMEGWITIIHLWMYLLVVQSVLATDKMWKAFLNTSVGVSVILVIYGLFQYLGKVGIHQGSDRIDATLGNAAYFAVYLLIHLFITALLFSKAININEPIEGQENRQKSKQKAKKQPIGLFIVYAIIMLGQLFALYQTATRGSLLGLIGGLLVVTVLLAIFEKRNMKVKVGACVVLALLVFAVVGFQFIKKTEFVAKSHVLSRMASITLADAKPRLAIWQMAYNGFKERPILGWGQEGFNYVFNKYYEPSMFAQEQWFDRAHNVFFDWLIAGGIFALLAYLALFFFGIRYTWKSERMNLYEKILFSGLFTAYFIHNLFVFDHLVSYILFFTLLAYVYHKNNNRPIEWIESIEVDTEFRNFVIAPIVIVALAIALYAVNVRPMGVARDLIKAMSAQKEGLAKNLEYFKNILSKHTIGIQEVREQLAITAERIINSPQVDAGVRQNFYTLTRSGFDAEIRETPQDARVYYFAAVFLNGAHQSNDALLYIKKAVELSPNKQTMYYELGNTYVRLEDLPHAEEAFKKAFELASENDAARMFYASMLISAGKYKEADEIFEPLKGTTYETGPRIIGAYIISKNYPKAVELYKKILDGDPGNIEALSGLATVYVEMMRYQAAIDTLEQVIKYRPELKGQAEQYIKELRKRMAAGS
jgi:O-antigen ligase/Tfp pilus assembly protein PilF